MSLKKNSKNELSKAGIIRGVHCIIGYEWSYIRPISKKWTQRIFQDPTCSVSDIVVSRGSPCFTPQNRLISWSSHLYAIKHSWRYVQ